MRWSLWSATTIRQSNLIYFQFLCNIVSIIQSVNEFNSNTVYWLALLLRMSLNLASRASECKKQLSAHNFVGFCLETTSTVVEVLRCPSPFRSLPSSPIRRTLTQMSCRTVAVHRRWYRSLWASTTLAVESPTDLFVASNWLERSS